MFQLWRVVVEFNYHTYKCLLLLKIKLLYLMDVTNNITVIIVMYNSTNIIFNCLKNLNKFNIILVDNGKNSKVLSELSTKDNITIVSPGNNIGMGRGVNFAFRTIQTDFFLLLSPDIEISEESILKLYSTILKNDNCAIAAPLNITDPDSYGILPEKRNLYEKNKNRIDVNPKNIAMKPEGEICVDVTKGCVLLIKSKYFNVVGGFSDKYFLFWEEIDLCKKFLKKKFSIIVNPSSTAYHKEGSSSKVDFENLFIRSYHHEISPLYYFKVKKNSLKLYRNMLKYIFRTISYFFILNFKNSIKNFSKLSANISYILK